MIFGHTGHVEKGLYVLGLAWTPSYLLDGPRPVLFESGFCCVARLYAEDIQKALGARQPEILFLTHVHYDHCGATSYIRKVFPGLKVAASSRAAEIIGRPNAQELMKELSRNIIPGVEEVPGIDQAKLVHEPFEPFEVDMALEDGQEVHLDDGLTVRASAVPGHTRDLLSYYIPEKKILFATESVGNLDRIDQVITEFLVDYESYMKHLRRQSELDIEVLCLGHQFVITGADVKPFLSRSIAAAEHFKEVVDELLLQEDGAIERVVVRVKAEEYDINPGPKQLEQAYLINLTTRVNHLAKIRKRQQPARSHRESDRHTL
jgi:glyoxylase-like metal-dependent hydrolase (beta-lactamase superfamily II)